jgi:hypothetical protein
MEVSYRPMRPRDVRKCVEHVATHPILGGRYGNLIEYLPSVLSHLLSQELTTAIVYEEVLGSARRLIGASLRAFVSDNLICEVKNKRNFWIGPEVLKRIGIGKSPLLSDAEIRSANSTGGLNLLAWQNSARPEDLRKAEVTTAAIVAFEEYYRGFNLKELMVQADCLEHMQVTRNAGLLYFDRVQRRYGNFPGVCADNFADEPRNLGMTRDLALTCGGSWLGSLFLYPAPHFGFSRSEQRLLMSALADGGTDQSLSDALGISVFTVKQTWRKIYHRVAPFLPDLVSIEPRSAQSRGKQKRQLLLAYVRKHPEELRLVSRSLLSRRAERNQPTSASLPAPHKSPNLYP